MIVTYLVLALADTCLLTHRQTRKYKRWVKNATQKHQGDKYYINNTVYTCLNSKL